MVIVKYSVILQNYKSIRKIIKGLIELDKIHFINFKILTNKY